MKSNIMGLEDQTPRLEGWTRATEEETSVYFVNKVCSHFYTKNKSASDAATDDLMLYGSCCFAVNSDGTVSYADPAVKEMASRIEKVYSLDAPNEPPGRNNPVRCLENGKIIPLPEGCDDGRAKLLSHHGTLWLRHPAHQVCFWNGDAEAWETLEFGRNLRFP